jgi:hypothetical protein
MCVCLARIIHSHHGRRCDRVRREERFAQRTVTTRGACVGGDGAGLSARALRARSTAHLLRRTLAQRLPNAWPAVPAQRRLCAGDAPWWLPQGASAQPPGRWRSDGPGRPNPFLTPPEGRQTDGREPPPVAGSMAAGAQANGRGWRAAHCPAGRSRRRRGQRQGNGGGEDAQDGPGGRPADP